ncbi:MAG: MBL fold metallo-hydrolase [Thermodesulfobacteriota bacterium]
MIRFCVLASGSKGNCTYLESQGARFLVDAGLSATEITRRLNTIGVSPDSLNGVIVTHEHNDHIRGVGVISRRFDLPVYMTSATHRAAARYLGRIKEVCTVESGRSFSVDSITVHPFSIPHDAADPIGLCVSNDRVKLGISTDLGMVTRLASNELKGCQAVIMEANHDPEMLEYGPYPWELKQRIKGRLGHLSNYQTCQLLEEILHPGLQHIVLAHLSQVNNHPEKAYQTVKNFLKQSSAATGLSLSWQDRVGKLVEIKG